MRCSVFGVLSSARADLSCEWFWCEAPCRGCVHWAPCRTPAQNVPDSLIPHKTFTGNRPSTSVLLPQCNAYTVGQLLSLYENRIAVQARALPHLSPFWGGGLFLPCRAALSGGLFLPCRSSFVSSGGAVPAMQSRPFWEGCSCHAEPPSCCQQALPNMVKAACMLPVYRHFGER